MSNVSVTRTHSRHANEPRRQTQNRVFFQVVTVFLSTQLDVDSRFTMANRCPIVSAVLFRGKLNIFLIFSPPRCFVYACTRATENLFPSDRNSLPTTRYKSCYGRTLLQNIPAVHQIVSRVWTLLIYLQRPCRPLLFCLYFLRGST